MTGPYGLCVSANNTLWVASYSESRVLRFDNVAAKSNGAAANGVLGQPDFNTNTSAATAGKMNSPGGVYEDAAGHLWVADALNNRVLRFDNAVMKNNGADADGVLGQSDFTSSSFGLSATRLWRPFGVYLDSQGMLWVADYVNRRVLGFPSAASLGNGAAATIVLGQTASTWKPKPQPPKGSPAPSTFREVPAEASSSRMTPIIARCVTPRSPIPYRNPASRFPAGRDSRRTRQK